MNRILVILLVCVSVAYARRIGGGLISNRIQHKVEETKKQVEKLKADLNDPATKAKLQELLDASGNGTLPVITELLKALPADLVSKPVAWLKFGETPLHRASINDQAEAFKLLLPSMSNLANLMSRFNATFIEDALSNNNSKIVAYLMEHNPTLLKSLQGAFERSVLHLAAAKGDLELVKKLVDSGSDIWQKSSIVDSQSLPIHLAARFGHLPVVEYFIEKDSNFATAKDRLGSLPIHRAAEGGHLDVIEFFLAKGIDIDRQQDSSECLHRICGSLVHLAAAHDKLDLIKALESKGADMEAKAEATEDKWQPIHIAALTGHTNVVEYFVSQKSELASVKDTDGNWPIHLAARGGHYKTIEFFLNHEIDVDQRQEKYDETPLHIAAFYGRVETIKFLLSKGASLNAKSGYVIDGSKHDLLPIHLAAFEGRILAVKYIVETYPEQREAKDKDGKAPLFWAEYKGGVGNRLVISYLKGSSQHHQLRNQQKNNPNN